MRMQENGHILTILTNIGMTRMQAKIFLCCYQFGPLGISAIARVEKIARSTAYGIVKKLVSQGLLIESRDKTTSKYSAIHIDQLISLLDAQHKKIITNKDALLQEKSFFETLAISTKPLPTISYYNTDEIISVMYQKINHSQYVRSIFDIERGMEYFAMTYEQMANTMKISPGTTQRILIDSSSARRYIDTYQTSTYQLKLMSQPQRKKSDIMIMDNSVYHVSYTHQLIGIEIHDETFYHIQARMFDQLRKTL